MNRDKIIIRTSFAGIAANAALASLKAFVGLLTGSIAIVLDAVNNLSDALSSIVTIIGVKLSGKKPDKEHPYGHGRGEYMTAMIIAAIILYAGGASLVESVKKIISPNVPEYPAASIFMLVAAVAVKYFLGGYFKRVGTRVNSDSLVASGKDALLDCVISLTTIAAALIFIFFGASVEAWLGAAISLVIIRAGYKTLAESFSEILGERVDKARSEEIKATITSFPQVSGAYDLILHNYGPNTMIGSVHIEVPDSMTVGELDALEREITDKVLAEHGVILAGISVYSVNSSDDRAAEILDDIRKTVMAREWVLQTHGFFISVEKKKLRFDVIIDFACPDREGLYGSIVEEIKGKYPDFSVSVTLDADTSD